MHTMQIVFFNLPPLPPNAYRPFVYFQRKVHWPSMKTWSVLSFSPLLSVCQCLCVTSLPSLGKHSCTAGGQSSGHPHRGPSLMTSKQIRSPILFCPWLNLSLPILFFLCSIRRVNNELDSWSWSQGVTACFWIGSASACFLCFSHLEVSTDFNSLCYLAASKHWIH